MIANGIGDKLNPLFINPMAGFNPIVSTWVNSVEVDKNENGEISDIWKRTQYDDEYLSDYLATQKNLMFWKIDQFKCNNNLIKVKDLYSYKGQAWCVFRKKDNRNSLMVVGTRTIKEQHICEFTKPSEKYPFRKSFCPLILFVSNKKFYLLNSK